MSKLEQQFGLSVDGEVAIRLCREVSAGFGWRVLESSSQSISIKEVAPQSTSFTWPARIDIKIRSSSMSQCSIQLNGSVAGMGPIQRNHLQGQMEDSLTLYRFWLRRRKLNRKLRVFLRQQILLRASQKNCSNSTSFLKREFFQKVNSRPLRPAFLVHKDEQR